MREIKFRIWKPDLNRMDFVKLEEYLSGCGIYDQYVGCTDSNKIWMQFTGLLDKNGKEIYEGDFLEKNSKFYVAYCTGMNDGLGMIAGWYLQRDDFESWIPLQYNDYYEVCGNIYENSELLNNE